MDLFATVLGGLAAGMICGFVPYVIGWRKGQREQAIVALLVCGFCGVILGVWLALPAAAVFTIFILKSANVAGTAAAQIATALPPPLPPLPQPPPEGTKACAKCGARSESTARSCGFCGHPFSGNSDLSGS
jgi:hypothetical protein